MLFRSLHVFLSAHKSELDEDSLRRLDRNPLRILDSKNPAMQAMLEDAPVLEDFLGEDSARQFSGFRRLLDELDVAYEVNPRLVRGLDYYSHAVFEWITDQLGAQGTVCAGGRYDGLTERYGYAAPATGFAFNLYNLLFALDRVLDERAEEGTDILLFSSGQDKAPAQHLAAVLRSQGYSVARDIIERDQAASLDYARRMHFRYLLVIEPAEEEMILIRTADGENTCVTSAAIESGQFRI